jgi:hypothetical protein
VRNYSTTGPIASSFASFASKNTGALTGAITAALGGGILFYAMANRETLNGAETPPVLEPVSPETLYVQMYLGMVDRRDNVLTIPH